MPLFSLDGVAPALPADGDWWIAPGAMLVGDVRIANHVSVWFGAILRADNDTIAIGAGSNVQDNCVIHADPGFPVTVGAYCTIGHHATVHGCTIGDNTLVGMGATVLNGARVGRNCIIAANALVTEGSVIPDNSLVRGVPGKVAGAVDEHRSTGLRASADAYIAAWRRYRSGLVALAEHANTT